MNCGVMGLAAGTIEIGDQFGSWTVMDEGPLNGRNRYYLCRCVCGKERLVQGSSLRTGRSTSCGCSRYHFVTRDLTGETLGKWTVLERLVDAWGTVSYRCRCVCGTERVVPENEMHRLPDGSCGCVQRQNFKKVWKREREAAEDEIGKTFGSWTVLAIDVTPRPSRQRYYLCRCVCGTERSVRRSALVSGKSPNCGCGRTSRSRMT